MEAVTHHGLWWDPKHPDRQRVGTLSLNEREAAILTRHLLSRTTCCTSSRPRGRD